MASEGFLSLSVVEDVLKQHGTMMSDIDLASRKEEEAATRRYEAAGWLRRMVGVVGARDLPEEPTEEEFRLGLRNGIVLCNALNKVQPGAVPKVVEAPVDPTLLPDGAALSAYQYFENLRNFLDALEELGLPTFEASDLERGGKGSRVVNCVLALKSYGERKEGGKNGSCKYGGLLKTSSCGKHFARRNFEPFMNSLARSQSADKIQDGVLVEENSSIDFSLESTEMTSHSLNMLVRTILSNKKPEEVPSLVESMLSKVMQEFERRIASQNDLVTTTVMDQTDGTTSLCEENNLPETSSSCCEMEMVKAESSTSPSLKDESFSMSLKDGETSNTKLLNQDQLFDGDTSSTKLLKQGLLFDRQKTQVQELKDALVTTRVGIELMKTQYSEELSNLGKHMRILVHAVQGYHKILEENRKLYNQVQDLKGNIRVYCRVRPFLPGQSNLSTVGHIDDGSITILTPPKYGKEGHKSFTFNKVFGPFATQEEVFSDTQPLIRSVLDGYNVCIFAYGQTGAGKTYTMSGPKVLTEQSFGVNYRALNDLFLISKERKDTFCYEISVQMIEIYNEQVRDLLASDGPHKRLDIRNSSQTGFAVPDANSVRVTSTTEVIELMDIGQKNRAVSATSMNDRSSRSHSCLTIHVQGRELASGVAVRGCMHLVDLAGSERVNKSEVKGDRLKEAQHINKSLAALGDVISALAQKSSHIPYRNSKLTQLLQDSLGGQAKTLMFVHISPEVDAVSETLSTLKFAERVATVELGAAQVNKDNGEVKELRQQVASLKAALAKKEGEHLRSALSSPDIYGMKSGATSPAHPNHTHSMEDFGNIEVRSCSALMQEGVDMDLQDLLTASDSSSWPERYPNLSKFGSKETGEDVIQNEDALSAWEGDSSPHVPDSFYQGYIPDVRAFRDQHGSRANSVATEDLDDLDFATSESSEQDVLSQSSLPKSSNAVINRIKRPQSGAAKSSDVRSANRGHKPSPSRKISNAPGQTVSRSTRQPISGGVDGKRRPNEKTGSRK